MSVSRETARGRYRYHEEAEQVALVDWAQYERTELGPLAHFLFAIPNGAFLGGTGGQRAAQMARLKRAGLREGAADLFLSLARRQWHGLYVEMKKPRAAFRSTTEAASAVTREQLRFADNMRRAGYLWVACFGFDEARRVIEDYVASRDPREEVRV